MTDDEKREAVMAELRAAQDRLNEAVAKRDAEAETKGGTLPS